MKEALITVVILFLFYAAVHIYIKITAKKAKQENKQAKKVEFNAEFFGLGFIPTNILIMVIADNIYEMLLIYGCFLGIVYIADKVHKKHLNQKAND